jgi:ABC-type nitrate/sulfonate/bicarbonate transport system permease component
MSVALFGRSLPPRLQLGLQVASVLVFLLGWEFAVRQSLVSSALIPPPS